MRGLLFTGGLKKNLGALAPSAVLGTSVQIAQTKQCMLFWLATKSPRVFASDKSLRSLPSEDDHPCAVLFVLSYFAHGLFGLSRKSPVSFGSNLEPGALLGTFVRIACF